LPSIGEIDGPRPRASSNCLWRANRRQLENLTFQAGEERLNAGPGDIVIVPPEPPHKFTNNGPGRANLVCVHANPTFVTEWLE
jgi:mannose-6-phosphate isomerase-like protein (cupin superfamily)